MNTINISLPEKLKNQAQELVKKGYYASFSDLVRDCVRQVVNNNKYELWADEAKQDLKNKKAKVLKSQKDIDEFLKSL